MSDAPNLNISNLNLGYNLNLVTAMVTGWKPIKSSKIFFEAEIEEIQPLHNQKTLLPQII